jgi:hypothetical protein
MIKKRQIPRKRVVAGPFGRVPMEENSRRYISNEPVEVPLSTYYMRRIMHGELVDAPAAAVSKEGK